MFDSITIPRSECSAYFGILTQKDAAVEYHQVATSKQKYGLKLGFFENTTNVIALAGELPDPLTGCWTIRLRDDIDDKIYTSTIGFIDGALVVVADKEGLVWTDETKLNLKIFDACLKQAGCYDAYYAAKERSQSADNRGFWN